MSINLHTLLMLTALVVYIGLPVASMPSNTSAGQRIDKALGLLEEGVRLAYQKAIVNYDAFKQQQTTPLPDKPINRNQAQPKQPTQSTAPVRAIPKHKPQALPRLARYQVSTKNIHPDLLAVYNRAQQLTRFHIHLVEGVRSFAKQSHYVKIGASKTYNSRHLTGHAVDLAVRYKGKRSHKKDWYWCRKINAAMQRAAKELNVPIKWGGNWKSFPDGYHFQLSWRDYPKGKVVVKTIAAR